MAQPLVTIVPSDQTLSEIIQQERKLHEVSGEVCFYLFNIGKIFEQYRRWKQLFPDVKPYYAVKSNNEPLLLKVLVKLGLRFDCASKGEMELMTGLGVSPDHIVFSNTYKIPSHIEHAAQCGVNLMTFEDEQELVKMHKLFPGARLLLRVAVKSIDVDLNTNRFGCPVSSASELLDAAKKLGSNVVGVSFHVGGNAKSTAGYTEALESARKVFTLARHCGFKFTVLDIGGGFPGTDGEIPLLTTIAASVNSAIQDMTAEFPDLKVIAEPGRFLCCSCFTLAAMVFARRVAEDSSLQEGRRFTYFIGDGHHGSFYVAAPPAKALNREDESVKYPCEIWGPTCSPFDIISSDVLPELHNGDWVYFENHGAYTMALHTGFNGFEMPKICYYVKKDTLPLLEELGINFTTITRSNRP